MAALTAPIVFAVVAIALTAFPAKFKSAGPTLELWAPANIINAAFIESSSFRISKPTERAQTAASLSVP